MDTAAHTEEDSLVEDNPAVDIPEEDIPEVDILVVDKHLSDIPPADNLFSGDMQ